MHDTYLHKISQNKQMQAFINHNICAVSLVRNNKFVQLCVSRAFVLLFMETIQFVTAL